VHVRISFNCFSFVEVVQRVHTEHKECVNEICFDFEAQKDNTKLPFARSAKRLVQGMHSCSQEFEPCVKI
jgi:hypothetical protein